MTASTLEFPRGSSNRSAPHHGRAIRRDDRRFAIDTERAKALLAEQGEIAAGSAADVECACAGFEELAKIHKRGIGFARDDERFRRGRGGDCVTARSRFFRAHRDFARQPNQTADRAAEREVHWAAFLPPSRLAASCGAEVLQPI